MTDAVEVSQADRNAAHEFYYSVNSESHILRDLAVAFARHRLSAEEGKAELVEALEGIVHFGDAVAYRSDTLSVELRKWIAHAAALLAKHSDGGVDAALAKNGGGR